MMRKAGHGKVACFFFLQNEATYGKKEEKRDQTLDDCSSWIGSRGRFGAQRRP